MFLQSSGLRWIESAIRFVTEFVDLVKNTGILWIINNSCDSFKVSLKSIL